MSKSVAANGWALAREHQEALAREEYLKGPHLRAVRAREQENRAKYFRLAIVIAFFIAMLAAGLGSKSYVLMSDSTFGALVMPRDAARTGRISYRLTGETSCHYELFDNDFAEATKSTTGPCQEDIVSRPRPSANRFSWKQ